MFIVLIFCKALDLAFFGTRTGSLELDPTRFFVDPTVLDRGEQVRCRTDAAQ